LTHWCLDTVAHLERDTAATIVIVTKNTITRTIAPITAATAAATAATTTTTTTTAAADTGQNRLSKSLI
jgi:hypothetical protein